MECTKCGKQTNCVCLCGKCRECNGINEEEFSKGFEKWLADERIKR